jgi:hypothetical protein
MFFPANQEVLYTVFTKLSLSDDLHFVFVQAMNTLFLKSLAVPANVTVNTASPGIDSKF